MRLRLIGALLFATAGVLALWSVIDQGHPDIRAAGTPQATHPSGRLPTTIITPPAPSVVPADQLPRQPTPLPPTVQPTLTGPLFNPPVAPTAFAAPLSGETPIPVISPKVR